MPWVGAAVVAAIRCCSSILRLWGGYTYEQGPISLTPRDGTHVPAAPAVPHPQVRIQALSLHHCRDTSVCVRLELYRSLVQAFCHVVSSVTPALPLVLQGPSPALGCRGAPGATNELLALSVGQYGAWETERLLVILPFHRHANVLVGTQLRNS